MSNRRGVSQWKTSTKEFIEDSLALVTEFDLDSKSKIAVGSVDGARCFYQSQISLQYSHPKLFLVFEFD